MSNICKTLMPLDIELVPVLYMPHDGIADVWLRKNIKTETRNENGEEYEVQTADEVFFQIDSAATSEQNIIDNFDKFWAYGIAWTDERDMTDAEIIVKLRTENNELKECIVELSSLI